MRNKMQYKYNREYGTLQQFDEHGTLRSSMSMPKNDLNKLAQLNIKENILRKVESCSSNEKKMKSLDLEIKSDV